MDWIFKVFLWRNYSLNFQLTEEKLGKAERTENDPQFEILSRRTDKIKSYTEKLVKDGEAVLVPNPGKWLVNRRKALLNYQTIQPEYVSW